MHTFFDVLNAVLAIFGLTCLMGTGLFLLAFFVVRPEQFKRDRAFPRGTAEGLGGDLRTVPAAVASGEVRR